VQKDIFIGRPNGRTRPTAAIRVEDLNGRAGMFSRHSCRGIVLGLRD